MKLEINGIQYTNFTSAECSIRLDALSNTFRFDAAAPNGEPLPFKVGDACRVIVDGEKVLTGFVEIINVSYDGSEHSISVMGRDKTADLLDSTVDIIDDLNGENLTLKGVIEAVIKQLGLSLIVIDQAKPKPFSYAEDIVAPESGDNAFEFIEKYARKRHVLLTSNADGNIVIATNSGVKAAGAVQHIIGASDNNVLSSEFSNDATGRFNFYKFASQLNPVALNNAGDVGLASLVAQSGGVFDKYIRTGRQLVITSEASFSDENCGQRARWEADIRKARGLMYSADVAGYRVGVNTGELWETNKLYQIVDDFAQEIDLMLCNSVTFSLDLDRGSMTSLGFLGRTAYTLPIEEVSDA